VPTWSELKEFYKVQNYLHMLSESSPSKVQVLQKQINTSNSNNTASLKTASTQEPKNYLISVQQILISSRKISNGWKY